MKRLESCAFCSHARGQIEASSSVRLPVHTTVQVSIHLHVHTIVQVSTPPVIPSKKAPSAFPVPTHTYNTAPELPPPSTLQMNTPPLLPLPPLKHDLYAHEQRSTSSNQENPPIPTPHNPLHQPLQPIQPHRKPHKIGRHHHQNIPHSPNSTNHTISLRSIPPLLRRKRQRHQHLGRHKQRNQPPPHQQLQINIMPQRHKRKHSQKVSHSPNFPPSTPSQRNINIPHNKPIETPMPPPPKRQRRIIITHTANHIFRRIDAVDEGPETEEAPWNEEFEPDYVQVEVA